MSKINKFYRYEARVYAVVGSDGDFELPRIPNPKIELMTYNLHKETPKGYWIGYGHPDEIHGDSRWVSKTTKKRYAYPTKAEAMNNYIKRTERRIKILESHLLKSKYGLMNAKSIKIIE